ncbi:unnamed protein product [Brachionus calyciflorus]|uniref:Uncharacterized protein n=1 Tax=Brachionus calyciflorus TaxID=104777 RepID=A0A814JHJ5_9BILA|nr:unnamed protein product [Brachionus calyciflorus]
MSSIVKNILFFTLVNFVISIEDTCFYDGCRCVKNIDDSYDVMCVNPSDQIFPKRIKTNITEIINTFLIKQFKFTEIPNGTFDGLKIRNLIIGENNLEKITTSTFRGIKFLSLIKIVEKNFETIEPGSLDPISEHLNELGIWQINYKSDRIDAFFDEISRLKKLRTLSLMGYGLENFKSEWTRALGNISFFSLGSNDLKSIDSNLFKSFTKLQSIDLSNNFLTNLTSVFEALEPVKNTLREIKLSSNFLTNLKDFSMFSNLQILDLSNNKIDKLPKTILNGLKQLNTLYLSSNLISSISDEALHGLNELSALILDNNHLNTVPSIRQLNNLRVLDLSNQNGKLVEIKNYSFDRENSTSSLYINLDLNEIKNFGPKAFCSKNSNISEIRKLDLGYNTTSVMDKCLLKQLKSKLTSKVEFNVVIKAQNLDKSYCDCKLKNFVKSIQVDLVGPCGDLTSVCKDEQKEVDKCDKKEFECGV